MSGEWTQDCLVCISKAWSQASCWLSSGISSPCPQAPRMSKHYKILTIKNMININTREWFHSEINYIIEYLNKMRSFPSLCLHLNSRRAMESNPLLFLFFGFWFFSERLISFVFSLSPTLEHRKREFEKWTWDSKWNSNASLLLELPKGISVFSRVHDTNKCHPLFLRKRSNGCWMVLLCSRDWSEGQRGRSSIW